MNKPELYVFAISHYCEKARWALDFVGLEYELRHLAPGAHARVARELGATGTSLPFLAAGERVVHGSDAIMDWADSVAPESSRRLRPDAEFEEEGRGIEKRLDDVAGVHVRRAFYSEAILDHPESVLPLFCSGLTAPDRQSVTDNWAVVCQLMVASMDLGPEPEQESRAVVAGELDWLDDLLADGRRYLVGDRLSRVDITAASLLAPLASVEKHPTYARLEVPPRTSAAVARWSERPAVVWVREMYRSYR